MDNAPKHKYDYIFLESNYDEHKIRAVKDSRKKYGYEVLDGALRHFSTQQCREFYYLNRRNSKSELIELHKSNRFY